MITIEEEILPELLILDAVKTLALEKFGDEKIGVMFPSFDYIPNLNTVTLAEPLQTLVPDGFVEKGE